MSEKALESKATILARLDREIDKRIKSRATGKLTVIVNFNQGGITDWWIVKKVKGNEV